MVLKTLLTIFCLLLIYSCSTTKQAEALHERYPAQEASSCQSLAKNLFLSKNYDKGLEQALVDKKLVTFTNKFVTIQHPSMDWMNRARISLNKSIKNWNSNKYPAFYIFHEEDVVTEAKKYFQTVESMVVPEKAIDPTASKNLELVTGWMKSFESYQKDIDQLLEERISLQYNLSLIKKIKLNDNKPRDIKLSIKRNGEFVHEVITLRKEEKDLDYQVKKLKTEISNLDGALLKNGKIKDRVIRQAMLKDVLTILEREFEYSLKNSETPHPELLAEFKKIQSLVKKAEFDPTTYGVYRITNKVFIRELMALSKMDVVFKKFVETPMLKFKEVVDAFINNRKTQKGELANEPQKIGFFKRVYTTVSNITPKQAATGTGILAVAGLGVERYFWVDKDESVTVEDRAHEEQVERTKEEAVKKSNDLSRVIEIEIDELTKP